MQKNLVSCDTAKCYFYNLDIRAPPTLDWKGVPVAVLQSGLSRKVTAWALYSSLPPNTRLNTGGKHICFNFKKSFLKI